MKTNWLAPTDKRGLDALAPLVAREVERGLPRFMAGQADRLIRAMITETTRNPALLECSPASLFGSVIAAGQLGLTIGGPLGEAYLIPFNNSKKGVKEAQLIPGYRGIIQLAHRSDKLKRLTPGVVREGETFIVERGLHQDLSHNPIRNNKAPVTDYYVVVELTNGGLDFEAFTSEDAIEWRDRFSTTRNAPQYIRDKSPWYDMSHGFHQMALKTLIRKLAKRLPLSVDMATALALEDAAESESPQLLPTLNEVGENDEPEQTKAEELKDKLDKTKRGKSEQTHIPGVDDPAFDAQAR